MPKQNNSKTSEKKSSPGNSASLGGT